MRRRGGGDEVRIYLTEQHDLLYQTMRPILPNMNNVIHLTEQRDPHYRTT